MNRFAGGYLVEFRGVLDSDCVNLGVKASCNLFLIVLDIYSLSEVARWCVCLFVTPGGSICVCSCAISFVVSACCASFSKQESSILESYVSGDTGYCGLC